MPLMHDSLVLKEMILRKETFSAVFFKSVLKESVM